MSTVQIFNFENNNVRTKIINKQPYFCASDVCNILQYSNGKDAVNNHCKKDGVVMGYIIDRLGREQKATFISEPNLLRLIMKSTMPKAETFQDWVFEEVLPTIRKTGSYIANTQPQLPTNYIEALKALVISEEQKQALQLENQQKQSVIQEYIAIDDNKTYTNIAKLLHLRPNKFIELLRIYKYINKDNIPYQDFINRGYFTIKKTTKEVNNKTKHFEAYLITPKGFSYFTKQAEIGVFNSIKLKKIINK